MSLAGNGTTYIETIINRELLKFNSRSENDSKLPVTLTIRSRFNPNLESSWFSGTMQVVNNMTMLAIILTGAAVIREREHGTLEHLLVMPVSTFEIMISKIWANSVVLLVAATLSLWFVVRGFVGVPMEASAVALFVLGAMFYLFSLAALGILLATLATTMPQFGLLSLPICVGLQMLSGGTTSFESMPLALQALMETMPSPHFVRYTQGVLYRGAGLDAVWLELAAIIGIGALLFIGALARFRTTISNTQ
jgi:ABC-2 type transport system permease protein